MTPDEAATRNIVDMAVAFTAMTRLFSAGSNKQIADEIYRIATTRLEYARSRGEFEQLHDGFCTWACRKLRTAQKRKRLSGIVFKASKPPSYGQAAKVLDVALKVVVFYCQRPSSKVARRLGPWLHAAIDNPILRALAGKHPGANISAVTIEQIDQSTYMKLQGLIAQESKTLWPVEWDDVTWRRHKSAARRKRASN